MTDSTAGRQPAAPSLARSSAVMAAGTVVSRLLGFARAALLGGTVGIGLAADTFQVANTLPNQFYLLLAGGVLNAVLVPQITKAASHDDGGHEFVNRLLTLSLAILVGATVLATAAAPLLVRIFATGGWNAQALWLATAFAFICLPQVFFYGLYTLFGQVLNARGQFAAYMWAPALANLVAIGGLLWFKASYSARIPIGAWTPQMIWVLAGTTTLGVAAQAAALWLPLRATGFRYRPVWGFRGVGLGSATRVAGWTFAAVGLSQVGYIVTSQVMTRAGHLLDLRGQSGAGLAAYGYAFLLFMLPHSLITVSLVTALFTRLSRAAHEGDHRAVVGDLSRGLRMPAVLLVPGTVAIALLGTQAARVVFFDNSPTESRAIAQVMIAMMLGLAPFGWLYLIQRVFYAFEDAKTPFYLQVVVTVVATIVNLVAAFVDPAHTGIVVGVGQTLSNLAAAIVGFVLLRRRLGPLRIAATVRTYSRLLVASLVGAGVAWVVVRALMAAGVGAASLSGALVQLVVGGGVFVLTSLVLAHAMRVEEVSQLLDPLLRRVRRRPS
jgi:putative peptidoglycan lipid II flippase